MKAHIEAAPTWSAVLPIYLAALVNGSEESQEIARQELTRMAAAADAYNASIKGDQK